jgi:hypothetical protein
MSAAGTQRPFRQIAGCRTAKGSFDHLVGAAEKRERKCHAERLNEATRVRAP